jgi:predicted ArsR family transcriptional regulator
MSRTRGRTDLLDILQHGEVPLSALKLSQECKLTEMAARTFLRQLVDEKLVTASGARPLLYSWREKGLVSVEKAVEPKRVSVTIRWREKQNPSNVIRITISGLPPGEMMAD